MSSAIAAVRDRAYWLSRGAQRGAPRLAFVAGHELGDGAHDIDLPWPADVEQAVAKLTGGNELLAHVLVAAALDVTLFRYTGTPEVVIGTPPRRTPGQPEPIPNVLVMAERLDPAMSFRGLLLELRKSFIESYSHQAFRLEELQSELGIDRPLHTVTLVHEGLHGALPPIDDDLRLTVRGEPGHGRVLRVEASGRVPADVARGLGGHVLRVLRRALSDLEQPVGDIDVLEPGERTAILHDWNAPATPLAELVHQRFRAHCHDNPDAPAIIQRGAPAISYAQLGQRSRAIASLLATRGAGPEAHVGICVADPVSRAAAVLGVLESGSAYVPLDLVHPAARLSQMIGDAEPMLVLCDAETRRVLPLATPCVVVDAIPPSAEATSPAAIDPANAAYVMYTSGSTGAPNGVVVTHGGLANAVAHARQLYGVGPKSRVLQFSSFSFDASALELFLALTSGGALCVAPDITRMHGDALARAVQEMGADTAVLTPTVLGEIDPDAVPGLRVVSVGGERCPGALANRWSRRRLLNCYGPTETTLFSTAEICDGAAADPPIGRPIANTRAYVLNAALQPLPPGVPGELYIAGAGVARGYVGQPSRTAARFVPDPHSQQPGARMYRTGDVARHRADGRLEFLGRIDDQVKLSGIRIELGEIEAALLAHPDVTGAAVSLAGGDAPRLVAYIVSGQDPPSAAELRSFLEQRLAAYCVPSVFVPLARLPVTSNGKLDRRALPEPTSTPSRATPPTLPGPTSNVLTVLTEIWSTVLGIDKIAPSDNFFDLGGRSLHVTRVMAQVAKRLLVELPLETLFDSPTLLDVAALVEGALAGPAARDVPTPPIPPPARGSRIPLSFSQQRLWFLNQIIPAEAVALYNGTVPVRFRGPLDHGLLERAFQEVIARHEILRTGFVLDGEPIQVIAPEVAFAIPLVDLSYLPAEQREAKALELAENDAHRPFDLGRPPLLRAQLLRLADDDHVLVPTIHHIEFDAWSADVLMRELSALYDAFRDGRPSPLAPLRLQYADYAIWQRQWLQGDVLAEQLAYWSKQLADAPALELPTNRPRPQEPTYRGHIESFRLSADLTERLRHLSRAKDVTLFMTLLAGFKALLHRYTGQDDLVISAPVASRRCVEVEELIGFFVNSIVLRTSAAGNPTFEELLQRVRAVTIAAYAHQDLPFDRLVEILRPERVSSHNPLFRSGFSLQNTPLERAVPRGLTVEHIDARTRTTKFDLTIAMSDGPDGLVGELEYSTDLFDAERIVELLGLYDALLHEIAAAPSLRILEIPLGRPAAEPPLFVSGSFDFGAAAHASQQPLDQELGNDD